MSGIRSAWIDIGCGTRPYEYLFQKVKYLCMPIQLMGLAFQKILPDRREFFLDLIVIARRQSV